MPNSISVNATVSEFLECVHGRHKDGWLAAGPWNTPQWYDLSDPGALEQLARDATAAPGAYPYVGCATMINKPPIGSRGTKENARAIGALWLDVDIYDPDKPKPKAARDREHALELINRFPEPPSWVVTTPHGFHPWWALDRLVEQADIEELLYRWKATWQELAKPLGIRLDSVWEASRVLRLPTTIS